MCNYQVLYHHSEKGYVIRCLQCNNIQLGFGNVAITLCKDEFYRFQQSIAGIYEQHGQDEKRKGIKNIHLPTPCEGMMLLLSAGELNQLHGMLDTAETELRSQELISLFENH